MQSVLNDFWQYYRTVLSDGKQRVEALLNDEQRQKFEKMLQQQLPTVGLRPVCPRLVRLPRSRLSDNGGSICATPFASSSVLVSGRRCLLSGCSDARSTPLSAHI